MQKTEPLISFIIPVYNAESAISYCLNSVFNQGMDEDSYEVICVNDGSTDDSLRILNDIASNHTNMTVINQSNSGVGASRNAGMAISHGLYLEFLDADDFLVFNSVPKLIKLIKEIDADVLFYGRTMVNNYSESLANQNICTDNVHIYNSGAEFFASTRFQRFATNVLYAASFLDRNHLLFTVDTYAEDSLFNASLLPLANRIATTSSIAYIQVKTTNSATRTQNQVLQNKLCTDYFEVAMLIPTLIKHYTDNPNPQWNVLANLKKEQSHFLLTFLILSIKSDVKIKDKLAMLDQLNESHIYPDYCYSEESFPMRIFALLCKHRGTYCLMCFAFSIFFRSMYRK